MSSISLGLSLALQLLLGRPPVAELDYAVRPLLQADRTRVEVTLSFKSNAGEQVAIGLPRDFFGSPPLPQFVESFEGVAGTKVEAGKEANERLATANAGGLVTLKYVLSYDPAKLVNATFGPNVSAEHFYFSGCQWMLPIGDLREKRQYRIRVVDPPKGWRFFSSLGPDGTNISMRASYMDVFNSSLGGTSRGFYEFKVRGKRVTVSIPWSLDIPDEKVVDSVRKIVDLQRRWFKDDSDDYFHVAVNLKEGNIAGMCVRRHFVCFIKKDVTQDQLNVLLAHEMLHNWMGNQIWVSLPEGEYDLRHLWLKEGVNEYFARKLLLDAKLITEDLYVDLFNADLLNIRDNVNRNVDMEGMKKASAEGRFDTVFVKLAYYRGALLALEWDRNLRAKGKPDSSGFLYELFKLSKSGTAGIPEKTLFEVAAQLGIPLKEDFEKHIVRGESIVPSPDALGPQFELVTTMEPSYDVGFDLNASRVAGQIKGVVEGGSAHKAGLRDGMKLVSTGNSNRFANSWDKTKPLRIVVTDAGQQRAFEYFPQGALQTTHRFVTKK